MRNLSIYLAVTLLVIATWNAYVILWKTENEEKYSKVWHGIGLGLRTMVYFIPFFYLTNWGNFLATDWRPILKWTSVAISIGGVAYDFIINLIRFLHTGRPPLWYVDDKGYNAFFLKYLSPNGYWVLRGLFVLGTIIYLSI